MGEHCGWEDDGGAEVYYANPERIETHSPRLGKLGCCLECGKKEVVGVGWGVITAEAWDDEKAEVEASEKHTKLYCPKCLDWYWEATDNGLEPYYWVSGGIAACVKEHNQETG